MKLKNKKTGDIYVLNEFCLYDDKGFAKRPFLKSLAELNAEWEDYEEPKGMQWVDVLGANDGRVVIQYSNEEEAKKAVEKLKAWKRLKDKGFRFDGYDVAHNSNGDLCGQLFYNAGKYCIGDAEKDLDLLFSGEDD